MVMPTKLGATNKLVDHTCVVYYDASSLLVCVMFRGRLGWLHSLESLTGFEHPTDSVGCWATVGSRTKQRKTGPVLEQHYRCFVISSEQLSKGKNNGKMVNMAFDCDKLLKELILTAKVPSLNKFEREVRDISTRHPLPHGSASGSFLYSPL